jgi:hypothetical protein
MPGYEDVNEHSKVVPAPVRPFRKIELKFIPENPQRDWFRQHWRPVFKFFEEGLESTSVAGTMTPNLSNQSLRELFEKGMQHLKQCASYLFANPKREPTSWTIAYTGQRCYPGR